jgi:hypothetical protein
MRGKSDKVFVICESETIRKAHVFIETCHNYWKGLLVFLPLLFYRIIVEKLKDLSEFYGAKFKDRKPEVVGAEIKIDEIKVE